MAVKIAAAVSMGLSSTLCSPSSFSLSAFLVGFEVVGGSCWLAFVVFSCWLFVGCLVANVGGFWLFCSWLGVFLGGFGGYVGEDGCQDCGLAW